MATGGRVGGGGRVVWLGWGFGEKKSENHVFHAKECIYNLQISLNKLVSLSGSPFLSLSATIRAQHNSLSGWNCA